MKPYAAHIFYRDEDWAPTTKHFGSIKKRKEIRRAMHKKARNLAKRGLLSLDCEHIQIFR